MLTTIYIYFFTYHNMDPRRIDQIYKENDNDQHPKKENNDILDSVTYQTKKDSASEINKNKDDECF